MATLTRICSILAFDDTPSSRQPLRRFVDWKHQIQALSVENPDGGHEYQVEPGDEVTIFDGTRALGSDGTTVWSLELSPLDPSRYRLTRTSGAAPAFRTARSTALFPGSVTVTVQNNQTAVLTSSLGAVFGAVVAGDTVLLLGASTGDTAGPFDAMNEGLWLVLAASTTQLTLRRPVGSVFSAVTETVVLADNAHLLAYSNAGVQVGDKLALSAGFAPAALHAYEVLAVTPSWVEFASSLPLAEESGVTAAGVAVYSAAKRYVYVETDQEVALKFNGNALATDVLEPVAPGDAAQRGPFEKFGTAYSLSILNLSTATAKLVVITAE